MSRHILSICLAISSLTCISLPAVSATKLQVSVQNHEPMLLTFDSTVRLDTAVTAVLDKASINTVNVNWMNSTLFNMSQTLDVESQVFDALSVEQTHTDPIMASSWGKLAHQLSSMHFAKRVFIPVDPDITVLTASLNPQIEGEWQLHLPSTPSVIYIYGAIKNSGTFPWESRTSTKSYIEQALPITPFLSEVTVIQPDGKVETHQIAYWNENFKDIAPGAIIYVDIPRADSEHLKINTNHQVVELLRNRIPL
ncbi:capsule biosynthesis GfcC family protein [Vibrio ziniensis]|uniref:Uncharacterized protein n=1 Tax=Vibrio ziniensis TaxID=2711221 RepID=A0A6G7CGS6_9VIBR|nr:capsule biosynthesis GfcC family protein [Vibrio ziniensis]QIH41273.1 hypothetical protein G5S32_04400 [Vibrio ziniensis]